MVPAAVQANSAYLQGSVLLASSSLEIQTEWWFLLQCVTFESEGKKDKSLGRQWHHCYHQFQVVEPGPGAQFTGFVLVGQIALLPSQFAHLIGTASVL